MMQKSKSPLKELEKKFGKINSKKQAQMVANTAKELLVERNKRLIRVLASRIKIEINGKEVNFKLFGLNDRVLAEVKCIDLGDSLHIDRLTVGKLLEPRYGSSEFTDTDSLRELHIGKLLIRKIKEYAKKKKYYTIKLSCDNEQLQFYLKQGFIVRISRATSSDLIYRII